MEALPLHPKLVHLPIALAVLMPLVTSGLLLAWWRGWLPKRTWVLAVAAQAMLFGSALLAMRTGEADEHRVERVVPENKIEAHEEAAEAFSWAGGAVVGLALLVLLIRAPKAARITGLVTVAGTLVVLFLGYKVGEAGGELVYRHGAAAAFADRAAQPVPGTQHRRERERGEDDDR